MPDLIPYPSSFEPAPGTFQLTAETALHVLPGADQVRAVAESLARRLRPSTGYDLPVRTLDGAAPPGSLSLDLTAPEPALGGEGYDLAVTPQQVRLSAPEPAGLFRGTWTLQQLLPPAVEARTRQPGPWAIGCCIVRDTPRFAWRGMMLDVARHFFTVEEVKRLIDQMAYYKLSLLHLHLTDDQGWRLMIDSWPRLAGHGGSTATHGDRGGYYTQDDYRVILGYAAERYITVVPEIDMPGHTHAALDSYPELKGTTKLSGPYTGTEVGFSSFAIHEEMTYRLIEQVIGELAALTPGPYLHIGGDEAQSTPEADYIHFVERIQAIVRETGKRPVGWEEVAKGRLLPDTIIQYWWQEQWGRKAARAGNKLIMSPAARTYMDIKYNAETRMGQDWTRSYIEVQDGYDWDPASVLDQAPEETILGVEAPLWTETVVTADDLDYMTFPRLPGYAEVGWTPQARRSWADYRLRLAAHGPRLEAMGIRFYRSPQIAWE